MAENDLIAVGNTKIYIGDPIASKSEEFAEEDFGTNFVMIDGWQNMGNFGDSAEIISANLINRNRTIKQKGSRDAQNMENEFVVFFGDPGQQRMVEAEQDTSNYEIKIVFDDAPAGGGTGSTVYFIALVNDVSIRGGPSNENVTRNGTLAINCRPVIIPAA